MSTQQVILNTATVTTSGSDIFYPDGNQIVLLWNIQGPITGSSPTIQFSVSEVDPTDLVTNIGQTTNSPVITAVGLDQLQTIISRSPALLVRWTVTGVTPSFGDVNLSIASGNSSGVTITTGGGGGGTVDQGAPGLLTNGWPVKVTDGTNVLGTSTHPFKIDPTGTTTQPVSGTVTANAGSGTFTVGGTVTANIGTTNGLALDSSLTTIDTDIKATQPRDVTDRSGRLLGHVTVDNFPGTQPISGTVTANIGTTGGLALDTSVNGILVTQGSTTAGETGPLVQGAVTTGAPVYTTAETSPLSLTTAGALRVDGSSTTQPVSGTVTANAGTGTFTVGGTVTANAGSGTFTVGGTVTSNIGTTNGLALDATLTGGTAKFEVYDGTNVIGTSAHPVRIDPTGTTTQPVSGTVIANAGSGIFTVGGTVTANIGTTNGLALDTSVTGLQVSQGSTTSGQKGGLTLGAVTTAAPSYTTAQSSPLSLTTAGALRVDGSAVTQPISGTVTANAGSGTFTVSGTVNQGTANTAANSWPVEVTDGTNTLGVSAHPLRIDPTGTTTQPISGTVTANAGTGTFTVSGTTTSNQGAAAALSGAWPVEITDGTNVLATATHPVRTDPTGTTTQPISGTVTANAGSGTFTVSGTVTSNIGTTNGLALDTSVNGILLSQGSATSGEKGPLIQGAVTTAAPTYTTAQTSPLSLTTAGALRVDGSAVTQPVSGTITANAGSGTFTVSGTTTANQGTAAALSGAWPVEVTDGTNVLGTSSHPVRTDPTGTTTQPVSGTVTANAGSGTFTVSGTVTSNIGTTNGLALDTSVNGILISQGSTTSGEKGPLIQGAVTTAAPTYTTAQTSPLSLTTAGALRVDASATTQPVSGTVTANAGSGTFTVGGTVTANIGTTNGLALDATLTGGTAKTQMFDGTNVIGTSSHPVRVDPTGTTTQPVSGTVTANIGTSGSLALDASVTGLQVSQGSTTSGQKGGLILGAVTTAAPTYITAQTSPISLTTAGAVRVDGSAVTQPVSGTVTANAGSGTFTVSGTVTANQGGTWTVQPGNTANTTPWLTTINQGGNSATVTASNALKIDGSAVTQPVSGTVTSNQGTANSIANAWPTTTTDGTNTAAVAPASTAATTANPAAVVALSPNSPLPNIRAVDSANSSTTTLAASGSFTGTGTSGLGYASLSVMVVPIGATAPPGTLIIEQSSDNSNWDIQDTYSVPGGTASPAAEYDVMVNLRAQFYRIVYNNGATAQTAFRLQTIKIPVSSPLPDAPTAKGTQAMLFMPVQEPKDTGRTIKVYTATSVTGVTTEAMLTLTPLTNFTAGSTGSSFSVTSGKTFRIQSIVATIQSTTTTAVSGAVRLRISASGTVTTGTTATASIGTDATSAQNGGGSTNILHFPDGLEISGTMQFGLSQVAGSTSSTVSASIIGYEY